MYRIAAIFLLCCSIANALVRVENNRVRFSFNDDGSLSGIRDKQSGKELLAPECRGPLFRLRVRGNDNKPRDIPFRQFRLRNTEKKGDTVYFQFVGEDISVKVCISAPQDTAKLPEWRINVKNNSLGWVDAIRFPILPAVRIAGGDKDSLVIRPDYFYSNPSVRRNWNTTTSNRYAGGGMQWLDLYQPSVRGVYVASHDKTGRDTDLQACGKSMPGRTDIRLIKYVRILPGQEYKSPPYIVLPHKGDWHVGADIYRKWTSTWMTQPSIPPWFADCDVFSSTNAKFYIPLGRSLPDMADLLRKFDVPLIGVWFQGIGDDAMPYPHPSYTSEAELAEGIDKLHRKGLMVMFYINSQLYSVGAYRNNDVPWAPNGLKFTDIPNALLPTKDWVLHNQYRSKSPTRNLYGSFSHIMCSSATQWQEYLHYWALDKYVKQYGADGIYFDQIGCDGPYRCDNFNHGHSDYGVWGRGNVTMLKRLIKDAQEVNPNFITGQEGVCDYTGQLISWNLQTNTPEIFRYVFPKRLTFSGRMMQRNPREALRMAFLTGSRFLGATLRFSSDGLRLPDSQSLKLLGLRRNVKQILYRAEYLDTIGLKWRDSSLKPRLLRYHNAGSKALIINMLNDGKKSSQIMVQLRDFKVNAAWSLTSPGKFKQLQGTTRGKQFLFQSPTESESTVVLVDNIEPMLDVPSLMTVAAPGSEAIIKLRVRNLNNRVQSGQIKWELPASWKVKSIHFGPLDASKVEEKTVRIRIPRGTADGVYNLYCLADDGDLHARRWVGVRVVSPLDATLKADNKGRLVVLLENIGADKIMGTVHIENADRWKINPPSFNFSVNPASTKTYYCKAAGLLNPAWREHLTAMIVSKSPAVPVRKAYLHLRPVVMNPGFEVQTHGQPCEYSWRYYWSPEEYHKGSSKGRVLPANITLDSQIKYEGKVSLRMAPKKNKGDSQYVAQWGLPLKPNTKYRLTVAIRRSANDPKIFAAIRKDHGRAYYKVGVQKNGPVNTWKKFSTEFTTPSRSYWCDRSMDLEFNNESNTATVWFDAVQLVEPGE